MQVKSNSILYIPVNVKQLNHRVTAVLGSLPYVLRFSPVLFPLPLSFAACRWRAAAYRTWLRIVQQRKHCPLLPVISVANTFAGQSSCSLKSGYISLPTWATVPVLKKKCLVRLPRLKPVYRLFLSNNPLRCVPVPKGKGYHTGYRLSGFAVPHGLTCR